TTLFRSMPNDAVHHAGRRRHTTMHCRPHADALTAPAWPSLKTTTPPTAARPMHMPALRRREAAPPLPHGSIQPWCKTWPRSRTTGGELTAEGRAAQDDLGELVLHRPRCDRTSRM